jgi:adenosylhomocysteine nucleosidase
MPRLAIVAALEREVRPLIRSWRFSEKDHEGRRFRFFENGETVLVCGGIGAAAARRASEAVIAIFNPQIVCSAGFAGALDGKLQVADILRPRTVIDAGDGSNVTTDDGEGVLLSFMEVASTAQKSKLRESYGAQAIDMEAASVARAAQSQQIPFIAIKAISDVADFDMPPMDRFVTPEGNFSELRFAFYAAIRPWLWPQVARLGANSKRAACALCKELGKSIS